MNPPLPHRTSRSLGSKTSADSVRSAEVWNGESPRVLSFSLQDEIVLAEGVCLCSSFCWIRLAAKSNSSPASVSGSAVTVEEACLRFPFNENL